MERNVDALQGPARFINDDNLAECGVCGRNKPVCCDEGYTEDQDGTRAHVGAVCVDCCGNHAGAIWDGKSVAGGTFERCE